ncbi:MAG: LptF/LptG family permease [Treponema sp.]|jgi:lipopolysaccharide export system permease protein|nr:LptF/LptG family permease [Treponema sp.]
MIMILDRYLARQFLPIFAVAAAMFMMIVSLIDLFANLWRYLNYEVPLGQILTVSIFYLPKSFSYAMPVALLFAAAYTLGDLYSRNELTSVFSAGIPFWRFSMALVAIGFLASVFSFLFDDTVVIPTLRKKNEMSRQLLRQVTENNSDIVIKARGGQLVYSVDYYDRSSDILNGLIILEQNDRGEFISQIRSPRAVWNGEYWELSDAVIYQWEQGLLRVSPLPETDIYREQPDTFKRSAVNVEELSARDAGLLVKDLKKAGLPYIEALSEFCHRFSFAVTPLVVMLLSISLGGRFRKNILLMSLLTSLGSAVVYFVMEMISMMMAKLGYIPPLVGAWFPVAAFITIGALLLRNAKT